jgi:hypothetical protein
MTAAIHRSGGQARPALFRSLLVTSEPGAAMLFMAHTGTDAVLDISQGV